MSELRAKIERMVHDTRVMRLEHRMAYRAGHKGREIDAAACAIRERALLDVLALFPPTQEVKR